jgi:lipopolysaccharide/colanic/teichoic acid biosynthesis glycosyltransferase
VQRVNQFLYLFTKRIFDILLSVFGLLLASPALLPIMFIVWLQDRNSPFYVANRVGKNFEIFKMVKLRSMVANADKTGVDSTSNTDLRITTIGKIIRRYKLDEITQLWNVLKGEMSLVGPRPNVSRETDLYSSEEKKLLSMKPGITDFASIVFSDEGEILEGKSDPDLAYNQLIRPGKSKFGLYYIENRNSLTDFVLIFLTLVTIVSRHRALKLISMYLTFCKAPEDLILLALRTTPLVPSPPPGMLDIVKERGAH